VRSGRVSEVDTECSDAGARSCDGSASTDIVGGGRRGRERAGWFRGGGDVTNLGSGVTACSPSHTSIDLSASLDLARIAGNLKSLSLVTPTNAPCLCSLSE